jgi:hypothetical protein
MWESDVDPPYAVPDDATTLEVDYHDDEAGLFVPLKNSRSRSLGGVSMNGGMWIGGL